MSDIVLTSQLAPAYHEALEDLLFFNPNQSRVTTQITRAVADFGTPKIVNENGCLRIRLTNLEDAQSLYALQGTEPELVLVGLLVFHRRSISEVMVVHLAVDEEFLTKTGHTSDDGLVEILQQFRAQLKRVKGVDTLSFYYAPCRFRIGRLPG